jgi:hypothetical protein
MMTSLTSVQDKEVDGDLLENQKLSNHYTSEFSVDDRKCHCDCTKTPERKVRAASMLAQVGKVYSFAVRRGC